MSIETQVAAALTRLALSLAEAAEKDPENTRLPVLVDAASILTGMGAKMNAYPTIDPLEREGYWQVMHDMIRVVQLSKDVHSDEWAIVLHGLALSCLQEPEVFLMFVQKIQEATMAVTSEMCNCPKCTARKKKGGDTPH